MTKTLYLKHFKFLEHSQVLKFLKQSQELSAYEQASDNAWGSFFRCNRKTSGPRMEPYGTLFKPRKRKFFDKNLKLFIRGMKDSKYLITDV